MKKTAVLAMALTTAVTMTAFTSAEADYFNRAHFEQLKSTGNCSGCDLQRAAINGENLVGANLSGSNLNGASLNYSNLSGANLIGTTLLNANLYMTNLSDANLKGATLIGANLLDANLNGANLSGAIWKDGRICAHGSIGRCDQR